MHCLVSLTISSNEEKRWITKLDPLMIGDKYITSLDAATGNTTAGGSYGESALISYLGRINYSYADKYLAQVTARRDGTSRYLRMTVGETSFPFHWAGVLVARSSSMYLGLMT